VLGIVCFPVFGRKIVSMVMFKRTVRAIAAVGIVFIGLSAVKADNISSTIRSVTKENSVDSASFNNRLRRAANVVKVDKIQDADRSKQQDTAAQNIYRILNDERTNTNTIRSTSSTSTSSNSEEVNNERVIDDEDALYMMTHMLQRTFYSIPGEPKNPTPDPMLPGWCSGEAFEGDFSYASPCEGVKLVHISCDGDADCTYYEAKFEHGETGAVLQDVCAVSGKFSKGHLEVPDDDPTGCVLQYFDLTNDPCELYQPSLGLKARIAPNVDGDRFDILFSEDGGQSYYNENDRFGPRVTIRNNRPGFGSSFPPTDGRRELLEGMDIEAIRQHRRLDEDPNCTNATGTQITALIETLEAELALAKVAHKKEPPNTSNNPVFDNANANTRQTEWLGNAQSGVDSAIGATTTIITMLKTCDGDDTSGCDALFIAEKIAEIMTLISGPIALVYPPAAVLGIFGGIMIAIIPLLRPTDQVTKIIGLTENTVKQALFEVINDTAMKNCLSEFNAIKEVTEHEISGAFGAVDFMKLIQERKSNKVSVRSLIENYEKLFKISYDPKNIVNLKTCFAKGISKTKVSEEDDTPRSTIIDWLENCDECSIASNQDVERKNQQLWKPTSKNHATTGCYKKTQKAKGKYDTLTKHIKGYSGASVVMYYWISLSVQIFCLDDRCDCSKLPDITTLDKYPNSDDYNDLCPYTAGIVNPLDKVNKLLAQPAALAVNTLKSIGGEICGLGDKMTSPFYQHCDGDSCNFKYLGITGVTDEIDIAKVYFKRGDNIGNIPEADFEMKVVNTKDFPLIRRKGYTDVKFGFGGIPVPTFVYDENYDAFVKRVTEKCNNRLSEHKKQSKVNTNETGIFGYYETKKNQRLYQQMNMTKFTNVECVEAVTAAICPWEAGIESCYGWYDGDWRTNEIRFSAVANQCPADLDHRPRSECIKLLKHDYSFCMKDSCD